MEIYKVESTRWYFSAVVYEVAADSESDAIQRVHNEDESAIEIYASSPQWNGKEEYLSASVVRSVNENNYVQLPLWKEGTA